MASGKVRTVGELAKTLATAMSGSTPIVTGEFRLGDIRHITASAEAAERALGGGPAWTSLTASLSWSEAAVTRAANRGLEPDREGHLQGQPSSSGPLRQLDACHDEPRHEWEPDALYLGFAQTAQCGHGYPRYGRGGQQQRGQLADMR